MTTRLALLVRHAQSTWNAEGRWQGRADPPLTSKGLETTRAASSRVPRIFTHILSSPLERANHTARLFAQELGITTVNTDARLVERSLGDWEGLTQEEVATAYPDQWARLANEAIEPEQWESPAATVTRIHDALTATCIQGMGPLLVVTHGGPITCIHRRSAPSTTPVSNLDGLWVILEPGNVIVLGMQTFGRRRDTGGIL